VRDTGGPVEAIASQLCKGCRSDNQGGWHGPGSCTRWECTSVSLHSAHFGKRWIMSSHDGNFPRLWTFVLFECLWVHQVTSAADQATG
jgi:hypothetical protein